jgi:hypothetical protein
VAARRRSSQRPRSLSVETSGGNRHRWGSSFTFRRSWQAFPTNSTLIHAAARTALRRTGTAALGSSNDLACRHSCCIRTVGLDRRMARGVQGAFRNTGPGDNPYACLDLPEFRKLPVRMLVRRQLVFLIGTGPRIHIRIDRRLARTRALSTDYPPA